MKKRIMIPVVLSLLVCCSLADQTEAKGKKNKQGGGKSRVYPAPKAAWEVADIILGAPTDHQITMSIVPKGELEGFVEYGDQQTAVQTFPAQVTLTNLSANTEYTYRLQYRKPGTKDFQSGPEYRFHTARAPGSPFVFEIQGDSHPERSPKQNVPELYEQTLLAAAGDRPDFYICMGDDFSADKLQEVNAQNVRKAYLQQLPYLGLVAHSSALFLVNGNHEQASRVNLDGTSNNVAVWAQNARNSLFPQPAPDGFYSGDQEEVPHIGLFRDYYAWTWGDALFVVIDPYWHSEVAVDNKFGGGDKRRDLWQIGLGDEQYRWFKQTLEQSNAKFKFVFAHHVNGTGRGGVKVAKSYEWGDVEGVKIHRPGWELPIHQLMAKNGVTIFFQGHDHIFAREELDGVIYQTLPDPANRNPEPKNAPSYSGADVFPNSGRVRVSVDPQKVRVEYIASRLPADATPDHPAGEIVFSYDVSAQ